MMAMHTVLTQTDHLAAAVWSVTQVTESAAHRSMSAYKTHAIGEQHVKMCLAVIGVSAMMVTVAMASSARTPMNAYNNLAQFMQTAAIQLAHSTALAELALLETVPSALMLKNVLVVLMVAMEMPRAQTHWAVTCACVMLVTVVMGWSALI